MLLLSGCGFVGANNASPQAAQARNPAQLSASSLSINFGATVVGGSGTTQTLALTNSGNVSLTISQVNATGPGFSISGPILPLSLAPSQSATFNVRFAPTVTGNSSGSITVVSDAVNSTMTITLTGIGVAATFQLSASPTSLSFGTVNVGSSSSQSVTLTNTGNSSVTISQVSVSGAGFSASGLTLPLILAAGQTATLSVVFAPPTAGAVTGSASVVSNATNSPAVVTLSGTGFVPTFLLSASPTSLSFGNVVVGSSSTQTVTLTNAGNSSVVVSQLSVSGAGFSTTGLTTPVTLAAGQTGSFSVVFAPTLAGSVTGSVSVLSNATNSPATVTLSGTGVVATFLLSASPTSLSFGNVLLGSSSTQAVTLTNSGNSSVTISQVSVSGAGFSASGLTLPLTLAVGQGTNLSVLFAPTVAGSVTGSVSVLSNATNSPATITLSGSGVQPALTASPTSLAFGNIPAGSSSTQTVTLTNTGNSSLTISQATITGAGFSLSGLALPLTLAAAQSSAFTVQFAPTATGSVTGSVSLVSNAPVSPTTVALSGTGVQPQLSVIPTSVSFGSVVVGTTNTQTVTLTDSGTASLTISQATVSGAGFSTSGLTLPLTLAVGQSTNFNVAFAPASTGSVTGSLSLVSDAPGSPTAIALSGTGVAATFQLTASPTSLSFGNVSVGSSSTQTVTLTNTGNSSLTVSQISASGAGFSTSGLTPPVTLTAGQSTTFSVVFAPTTFGAATGSVTVTSTATNSPAIIALSGVSHAVSLSWTASTSMVVGYNVYRGSQSGGPYTKLNSTPVALTSYTDSTVQSGLTYFYVATAVDSNNVESVFSNEVSATIP